MNLHRSSTKPDWDKVNLGELNFHQKIARRTFGVVTLANIISIVGLVLVGVGLFLIIENDILGGLVLVALGRLLDLLDGVVAETTQTKSSIGEMVDAVADKLATILTVLVLYIAELADWWLITVLILPQILISLISFIYRKRGRVIHPTRAGKVSMALTWVSIFAIVTSSLLPDIEVLLLATYGLVGVSALLASFAMWQYLTGRD